ncbi:MAG: hypothetical protein JOZ90_00405 [Alphaproteobacteria bacterium]|nr:hypothetical protein [Alphaproteobacteria bacterium]MBV9370995.1 hypothetical protein [Alphaproteobacteria bacterium]MBV9899538.1 hypothetical protein [Alphaproteobacteria bacterium]
MAGAGTFFRRGLLALAAAAGLAGTAAAQPAPVQTHEEALAQDAAEYAVRYDVPADEAARRLRAQAAAGPAVARLAERYRSRLAGIFVEHRPDYRITFLLTGDRPVRARAIAAGGEKVPVAFRTGAAATRAQVVAAIRERGQAIRAAVRGTRGMGADPRTGALVVMLSDEDADRIDLADARARIEAIAGVPARLRILERPEANFGLEGGARVEGIDAVSGKRAYCTTGFVVTDGVRTGIVTAAHCPDVLTYLDPAGSRVELPFIGQWGWSFQDVQLNAGEGAQAPLFYADAAKKVARAPGGEAARDATRAGDFLCHRGERSGYSCAEVELTDYAPPGDLCGGPCAPVWVTVSGPSCGGGDSGGPVFSGDVAYGIVKGGTYDRQGKCAFYYYMSLDYLPEGWTLLRKDDPPPAAENGDGNYFPLHR